MKLLYGINKVLENVEVKQGVFKLTIEGSINVKTGEAMFLRSWDRKPFLSKPVYVHEHLGGRISFLYEIGTGFNLLEVLEEDDEVELIGPFGSSKTEIAICA